MLYIILYFVPLKRRYFDEAFHDTVYLLISICKILRLIHWLFPALKIVYIML